MMRNTLFLLLFCAPFWLQAQTIPVRSVTIFKNGKAMVERSGKIPVENRRYTTKSLPKALFGTYWAASRTGDLTRIFTTLDSMESTVPKGMPLDMMEANKAQVLRIWLHAVNNQPIEKLEGKFIRRLSSAIYTPGYSSFIFQTSDGRFMYLQETSINRIEFTSEPAIKGVVKAVPRLELNFASDKKEQDIDLMYLSDSIGWMPVYRLDLLGDTKGRLSLRAEIENNGEDLGDTELRLAVGIPNFQFANRPSTLFNFFLSQNQLYASNYRDYYSNALTSQTAYGNVLEEVVVTTPAANSAPQETSSAEDFFFYSVRPGNFPKFSRFQVPVLEAAVETKHYFSCTLIKSTPDLLRNYNSYQSYADQRNPDNNFKVDHIVEMKNQSKQPWTTGAVNLLSENENGLQPISQSLLPFTAPGATCKITIAQAPDIKVNHSEAVTSRRENVTEFFLHQYDVAKVEGKVCVSNYKNEPATIKIKRSIVGKPLSSEQAWKKQEEDAYLWVNSSYEVEWEIILKPGEERTWKYEYEVLVDWR